MNATTTTTHLVAEEMPKTLSQWILHFIKMIYRLWLFSMTSLHVIYPLFLPVPPAIRKLFMVRLLHSMEEYFPVFDDTYYHLRISSRSQGNIQESVPTPITFRSESLVVAVIRHFQGTPAEQYLHVKKLLVMGADPNGITMDGPSWITPLIAAEIYCKDTKVRERLQSLLLLYNADINDTGWCGKNVLHYRIHQFCFCSTTENLISLIQWLNLPMVSLDVPVFQWHPSTSCIPLLDYMDSILETVVESPQKNKTRTILLEIMYSFGSPLRSEDVSKIPSLTDIMNSPSGQYSFYKERIAHVWQLSWNQMPEQDWRRLFHIMAMWVVHPKEFEEFFKKLWDPIETHRAKIMERSKEYLMDSIEFNSPARFPSSWLIQIRLPEQRVYHVWGGYLQVLFSHPVLPQTGETIDFAERERLWNYYLSPKRLLIFWKEEFTFPDSLMTIIENFKSHKNKENETISPPESEPEPEPEPEYLANAFLQEPMTMFLSPSQEPTRRKDMAYRYVLDRISQWIRKIHPYSNFHHLLDVRKMGSILFWKYLIQVLAHSPSVGRISLSSSSNAAIAGGFIRLMPFEKWVEQHIGVITPSLRIVFDSEPTTTNNFRTSVLRTNTNTTSLLYRTTSAPAPAQTSAATNLSVASMTILDWRGVFMKCIYLCTRENLDALHFRFEEEWNIIDFFLRSQIKHGNVIIQEQSDAYFNDLMEFYTQHIEVYPNTTYSTLHKKISALLRVFPKSPIMPFKPHHPRPSSPLPVVESIGGSTGSVSAPVNIETRRVVFDRGTTTDDQVEPAIQNIHRRLLFSSSSSTSLVSSSEDTGMMMPELFSFDQED